MTFVMASFGPAVHDGLAMKVLACVPLALSSLLLAAHFFRSGDLAFVLLVLLAPLLVATREIGAVRIVQFLLVAGAAEWVRTAHSIAQHRAVMGAPVTRMLVILGAVALVTLLAALPLPMIARRSPSS
jgi:hypothetical protein